MTNEHPDFYRMLGPFLARKEIVKELGGPIWDEDKKIWFLAMQDGNIAGFASMIYKSKSILFCEDYILPSYRNQQIDTRLIDERIAYCPIEAIIHAVVYNTEINQYKARGFVVKRARGKSFTEMAKKIGVEHD